MLTTEDILEIIKAINQSDITRFELEQGTAKLLIVKDRGFLNSNHGDSRAKEENLRQELRHPSVAESDSIEAKRQQTTVPEGSLYTLTAPMIGTFYAAPEPGAEPFVKVGQKVQEGAIVCVLEAMKLFNEIEAGVDGEISEVLVKDGQFVEYGQPLFVIKK